MAAQKVPVTVKDLVASVTQSANNIAIHRRAMAEVAAKATANRELPPQKRGDQK